MSSAYFPHSNSRAEIGVKTIKRLIMDNTGPCGTLDVDKFQRAILNYRNTPDRDTGLSPSMCVFGRSIRDFIPVHPGRYLPHPVWRQTLAAREEALRNRHHKVSERLTEHTQSPPPLKVGDCVRVQNQTGQHPKKWDKTGIVVEVMQYHQYAIKMDGSGRVSLRNRQFLKKIIPVIPREPIINIPGDTRFAIPQATPKQLPPIQNIQSPKHSTPKATLESTPPNPPSPIKANSDTPRRVMTRIYKRSQHVKSPSHQTVELPTSPNAPTTSSPNASDVPDPPTAQAEHSVPVPKTPTTKPQRVPLILKQLQDHNAPGLSEQVVQPDSDKRFTRQSTRK